MTTVLMLVLWAVTTIAAPLVTPVLQGWIVDLEVALGLDVVPERS